MCTGRFDREGVGIHPGVHETTLEFWSLAVCMPSLNILGEQCIKSAPGPAKSLQISWRLHPLQYEKLTPELMPGMRWLQIHHAGLHVEKGWKRLVTPYNVFQHCGVPEFYVIVRINLGYRPTVSKSKWQYSCKYIPCVVYPIFLFANANFRHYFQ